MFTRSLQFVAGCIARRLVSPEWHVLKDLLAREITRYSTHPQPHPHLLRFLVIGEDRRHGSHPGFDLVGITRAFWRRISSQKREGASTIAQQLVRTVTDRREQTVQRKLREILLAVLATEYFGAEQLAHLYLHIAFYGTEMHGLTAAAKHLNLDYSYTAPEEAAALIARIKYPQPLGFTFKREVQIRQRIRHLIFLSQKPQWSKSCFKPNTISISI